VIDPVGNQHPVLVTVGNESRSSWLNITLPPLIASNVQFFVASEIDPAFDRLSVIVGIGGFKVSAVIRDVPVRK
jgi:hypothetical protein